MFIRVCRELRMHSTAELSSLQFSPLLARTQTTHSTIDPVAYDCVKVVVVRAGGALLFSEFGTRHVNVGDLIVLAANTLCGAEPEGWVTTTTLYLDRDYGIDQVFWQYAEQFTDRLDAKAFLGRPARRRSPRCLSSSCPRSHRIVIARSDDTRLE